MSDRRHRLEANKNLTLYKQSEFRGYPVNMKCGDFIEEYLDRMHSVIHRAIDSNPRTFMIAVCLKIPQGMTKVRREAISAFIASFKAQLDHHAKMREKRGTRVHRHDLRYVWAKERSTSHHDHYHARLFLNADAYRTLGRRDKDDGNLNVRLLRAWATALKLYPEDVEGLVHMEGDRILRRGNEDQLSEFFEWCSYMCKVKSKHYGRNGKSFGYSQN